MKLTIACFSLMVLATSAFAQTERQILVTPNAEHPQIAKDSGLGGRVTVYVTVDPAGNVVSVGDVTGPDSVCPSVTRGDVTAMRESAKSAALNAKFAPSEITTTIPLNFDFPSGKGDRVILGGLNHGSSDYAGPVAAAPGSAKGDKPAGTNDRFTVMGASRATVNAEDKDRWGDLKPVASLPPPVYADPVATGSNNPGTPTPQQISGGVLNGKAVSLPKPPYPPAARAVRAAGAVSIQVLVIEDGTVFSAAAVSGHPLLRSAARQAACGAAFSPTTLMGNPVKVSGVITYNFVP